MHAFEPRPIPLVRGNDGVVRVVGTRVTLDVLAAAFDRGATAEEIAQQYPTLSLEDTYTVLAWLLQNRTQVDEYLTKRRADASTTRSEAELRHPPTGIRARLLARRAAGG